MWIYIIIGALCYLISQFLLSYIFLHSQEESEQEQGLAVFEEVVAPAMVECQELLKKTGDTVSDQGLELLAKWKLGMKK